MMELMFHLLRSQDEVVCVVCSSIHNGARWSWSARGHRRAEQMQIVAQCGPRGDLL